MTAIKFLRVALCFGIICACCHAAFAEAIAPTTPGHSWLFDEGSGTTSGAHTGGNDATMGGGASWSSNVKFAYTGNHSIRLGLENEYAYVKAAGHNIGTAGTISMWLLSEIDLYNHNTRWMMIDNTDTDDGKGTTLYQGYSGTYGDFLLYINGSKATTNAFVLDDTNFPKNAWHNIVATWDNSQAIKVRLYCDGTELYTSTTGEYSATTPAEIFFGQKYKDVTNILTWPGLIDEYAFWDTALSAEEVQWLSQHSLSEIPEPSTLALFASGLLGLLAYAWRKRK